MQKQLQTEILMVCSTFALLEENWSPSTCVVEQATLDADGPVLTLLKGFPLLGSTPHIECNR